jgi:hypothetical protein
MPTRLVLALGLTSLAACGGGSSNGGEPVNVDAASAPQDAAADGLTVGAMDASLDSPLAPLAACKSAVIEAPGACYTVLPTDTGASAAGENASFPSYALHPAPNATARHQLVVWLNGTSGHPTDDIASPTVNFYATAASLGYSVLGVSYRSTETVDRLCTPEAGVAPVDGCYFPTRETLILGVLETGAASGVSNIRLDEAIVDRTLLALEYLAAQDPSGGWGEFIVPGGASATPESQIVWSKIVTAGHSQGSGHAAALGKLFPVARVVQLSATCDATSATTAATWTDGATLPWGSDPSMFWGLGVKSVFTDGVATGGDTQCYTHLVVWENLGMVASHQNDDGASCMKGGATVDAHDSTIGCPENATAWSTMLQ